MQKIHCDIAIIGGGITGLWLLNELVPLGFNTILLEANKLGSQQTINSQGIIHGGIKYALAGIFTRAAAAVSLMPQLWSQCLKGRGTVDLSNVNVITEHQYIWSSGSIASNLATLLASKALRSTVTPITRELYPEPLRHPEFHGQVYKLHELILDTHSLVTELSTQHIDRTLKIDSISCQTTNDTSIKNININTQHEDIILDAKAYIFTAGKANATLTASLHPQPKMQLRPLHMVALQGALPTLHAHCIGSSNVPRLTITTYNINNEKIWYIGGKIAEEGIKRSSLEQIQAAKLELNTLLPWLELDHIKASSFMIDRAEVDHIGIRPDEAALIYHDNAVTIWPTKMTLVPSIMPKISNWLNALVQPSGKQVELLNKLPKPEIAQPQWLNPVNIMPLESVLHGS